MAAIRLVQVLLGFWATWFGIVTLTNVVDGLKAAGVLSEQWRCASGNYAMVVKVISIYDTPAAAAAVMFVLVIAWELLATVLFTQAALHAWRGQAVTEAVDRAVTVAAALFAAFILADEWFIAFPTGIEGAHFRILVAILVSWGMVRYVTSLACIRSNGEG